ncbi:heavy metal-responsive transcriptional regulator [Marinobacterium arenosum]|uniref:heavy metal-responsive transcriptional regulator n=1 Tax=Marinobacterium arenosum TaxID=2862496 RepID=UPI001C95EE18|nr:heavy metal-responsive transcriptional regulator [Marinobacterium arenosum]MBY4679013.1 heavy metal-responsive transcriptional regulator [Marinobacterium arenosum]
MSHHQLLRIGEIANQSGLSVEAIRYYERRGLITPAGRLESGYRLYSPDTLQRLQFILRCKDLGFSLEEILELLNLQVDPNASSASVKAKVEGKIDRVEQKIDDLQRLHRSLQQLNALCQGEGSACECPILEFLRHDAAG